MEKVILTTDSPAVGTGSAGLQTQVGNQPTTVSGIAEASGGIDAGNLIEPDIDEELFKFSSDDTPLMNLMLKAKKVGISSPEVDHFSFDEPTVMVEVDSITGDNKIKLVAADKMKVHAYDTISVEKVHGYEFVGGQNVETERPLMLYVLEVNSNTEFTVAALNGVKTSAGEEYGDLPTASSPVADNTNIIQAGTKLTLLSNALYETQKHVDPDSAIFQPKRLYLQKRGMNRIVSDYFNSQRKRIPFTDATIAEAEIRNFKTKGNRTLWLSQQHKFRVKTKNGDMQYVYTTEGVRWQFLRELSHLGDWTYEEYIALTKMFYTGEDIPKSCLALCGSGFLAKIQCIDWSKHPEATMSVYNNEKVGWSVTVIHTIFGDIQFKKEPTLDRIGYTNCAALIGEDRIVHYQYKKETSFSEDVEGEEAKRDGILVWDAIGLKGSCHIWVDGNGEEVAPNAQEFKLWSGSTGPTDEEAEDGTVYVFTDDATIAAVEGREAISVEEHEMWKYTAPVAPATYGTWAKYNGVVDLNTINLNL